MVKTAGRWPWKLEPAKECVTTHLPNHITPKTDGVEGTFNHTLISVFVYLHIFAAIYTQAALSFDGVLST